MILKRNHSYNIIFCISTICYVFLFIVSTMLIVLTLVDLKDYVKVPGIYSENKIIYSTLDNEVIEIEDKTINIYEENQNIYVYYHKDDVMKITTSNLVHSDIENSMIIIIFFSVPYWIFVIGFYIKKLKEDKKIIKNGKKICVNISEIEYDTDKLFGKYMIIKAKYKNQNGREKTFLSDKIYNDKLKKEIKNTGSVEIYCLENNVDMYVVYKYNSKRTIDWY